MEPINAEDFVRYCNTLVGRCMSEETVTDEMLRLAVNSCPSGMVMSDVTRKIVLVNDEIERLFGYRRDELLGASVEKLIPARLQSQHVRHRVDFIVDPEVRRMSAGRDLSGLRKDGTEFPVEVGLTSLGAGKSLLVLYVIVDASERQRTERLKDEFVSTVSHELRTPLTSISGSLGLIIGQAGDELPKSTARLIAIAHKNCLRLVRLINDILDIEKIESGQLVFNLGQVHVGPLVQQAIEAIHGFAEAHGVHVKLDTKSGDGEVSADIDRLTQVITNLLSNAIKFSPPNEEVIVMVEKNDDVVRISVRDHGFGIPVNFRPYIFGKFAQADASDSRQKGGTGLGLSIAKEIVERLGGEVSFADASGGGTIFNVTLPVWDAAAGQNLDLEAPPEAARILLCEDDHDAALAIRKTMRKTGFAVDIVYTARAAIGRADAIDYAAILVDLKLPDGDGISLIVHLRAQTRHHDTPITVISVDPNRGRDDARSSTLNVLGWLSKPVDPERLVQVVKSSIASAPALISKEVV